MPHTSHDELFKSFESKETCNSVLAVIDDLRDGGTKASFAVPMFKSIPDQVRKLRELENAGILTSAEFEGKKADLLARM